VTVLHEVELADVLTVRTTDGAQRSVRLTLTGRAEGVPAGDENLAVRAAAGLLAHANLDASLEMVLEKRIPVGSGLGGGSSDAAAALRAVDRLLGLGTPEDALLALARALGSDVPFLLRGGAALATGRGDVLERVDAADGLRYLVLHPALFLSTARVYGALPAHGGPPRRPDEVLRALAAGDAEALAAATWNALGPAAVAVEPRLGTVWGRARERISPLVQLTGSGSTLFLPVAPGSAPAAVGLSAATRHGFVRGMPSRAAR